MSLVLDGPGLRLPLSLSLLGLSVLTDDAPTPVFFEDMGMVIET